MNVLFLTISRIDDLDNRGIYTDLLRHFLKEGHKVYVASPTERRFGKETHLIEKEDHSILKIKTLNIQKTNFIEKGIGTILLERQFEKAIDKYYKDIRFDLVLYSTPPITLTRVIERIKKRDNAASYLLLKDIFPQNAVDIGMMASSGLLYRYFRKKEKKLYELSDYIGCMSPANVDFLLRHNPEIDRSTVEVCPNSVELEPAPSFSSPETASLGIGTVSPHPASIPPQLGTTSTEQSTSFNDSRTNDISLQLEISKSELRANRLIKDGGQPSEPESDSLKANRKQILEKFDIPEEAVVFIYGGNLGKPQGLDFLLRVLEANQGKNDRYFLVVGSGTEYGKIAQWFRESNPSNAQLIAALPKQEYDDLVQSCDVGLIFLDPRFTIPNYPSRLLSYLEYKMPVLMATDVNTDIGSIAEENCYGLWCENGDLEKFNQLLDKLTSNQNMRHQMGENGYKFLLENYTVKHSYEIIMKHFE